MNMPLKHATGHSPARGLENEFSVVLLKRDDIFALGDGWARLVVNGVEDNPYYSPAFMVPLLEHVDWNCSIQALAVYKGDVLASFSPESEVYCSQIAQIIAADGTNRTYG